MLHRPPAQRPPPAPQQGVSRMLLLFHDPQLETEFRRHIARLHLHIEHISLAELAVYVLQVVYCLHKGAHFLLVAYLFQMAMVAVKYWLWLQRAHIDPNVFWRPTITCLTHVWNFVIGSYFVQHAHISGCSTAAAFWGSQLLTSTLPWLILNSLSNGLLYHQLLLAHTLATGAVLATNWIRCDRVEAACDSAGVSFQDAAALLSSLAMPFLDNIATLRPRPACLAVMSLLQIWVGYFFVMVVRWRTDVAERRRFATARGLHRAAASLSELQEGAVQHSLLWAYLLGVVTWQALLAVLHSWH